RGRWQDSKIIRRCEGVDKIGSRWCAPTRAKIKTRDGQKIRRASGTGVVANNDVVKQLRIVRSPAKRVDGRIEKTDRRLSQLRGLLVDERGQAGPQRRGATG